MRSRGTRFLCVRSTPVKMFSDRASSILPPCLIDKFQSRGNGNVIIPSAIQFHAATLGVAFELRASTCSRGRLYRVQTLDFAKDLRYPVTDEESSPSRSRYYEDTVQSQMVHGSASNHRWNLACKHLFYPRAVRGCYFRLDLIPRDKSAIEF